MTSPGPGPAPAGTAPQRTPGGASAGRLVGGLLLIALGSVWLLDQLAVIDARWQTVLAGALIAVGGALVAVMRSPASHAGLVVAGVLLTAALLVTTLQPVVADVPLGAGVGDRVSAPTTMAQLEDAGELSIGSLQLDLRGLQVPSQRRGPIPAVEVNVGVGQVSIQLPEDTAVRVTGGAGIGEVRLPGGVERNGFAAEATWTSPEWERAPRRLDLRAEVGVGEVEVLP